MRNRHISHVPYQMVVWYYAKLKVCIRGCQSWYDKHNSYDSQGYQCSSSLMVTTKKLVHLRSKGLKLRGFL